MNRLACRYAIVRFLPYSETGEFANAGVVLACPETGFFEYRIQTRKHKRITDFFGELNKNVYLRSVKGMQTEMDRCIDDLKGMESQPREQRVRDVLASLAHPREAIVRFSEVRAILTADPKAELDRLFSHYVERDFATPAFIEQEIEKRVRATLSGLQLANPFRPERVGDSEYFARFPFVQKEGEAASKIIKPFNLAQAEPVAIYEHGDLWMTKLRRLRQRGALPSAVLFAVEAPPSKDEKRTRAYLEVTGGMREIGVEVKSSTDLAAIEEFAKA